MWDFTWFLVRSPSICSSETRSTFLPVSSSSQLASFDAAVLFPLHGRPGVCRDVHVIQKFYLMYN